MIPVSLTTGTTPFTSTADLIRRRIAALAGQGFAASPNPAHHTLAPRAPIINPSPTYMDERAGVIIRETWQLPAIVEQTLDD
jgi:hypothetical protein